MQDVTGEPVDAGDSVDDEVKITRINFDAQQGNTEIWATMPNVAMLAAECTELLKANDAKNYVQFDMIPRAESGVEGYRVTVQRLYGKSPAQRVIEMEKEVEAANADRARLVARCEELRAQLTDALDQLLSWHYSSKHEWGYPFSEEMWAKNPLRQQYKNLTGANWVEPIEPDMNEEVADNE